MGFRVSTNRIVFHHSLSTVGDAETIRQWHLSRGFNDIGYHFVITSGGETQEGRDIRLVGAHAIGKNYNSIGVCLIGNFFEAEPIDVQIEAAQQLYHECSRAAGKNLFIDYHRPLWLPGRGGRVRVLNPCPGPMLDRNDFSEILMRAAPYPVIPSSHTR